GVLTRGLVGVLQDSVLVGHVRRHCRCAWPAKESVGDNKADHTRCVIRKDRQEMPQTQGSDRCPYIVTSCWLKMKQQSPTCCVGCWCALTISCVSPPMAGKPWKRWMRLGRQC